MIRHIVVVGSGVMGRGIAYVSAVGGFETTLIDVKEEQLKSAKNEISSIFEQGITRGKITNSEKQEAEARLHYSTNLIGAVKEADLVIEAVPEKLEIKNKCLRRLINMRRHLAILQRIRQR